MRSSSSLSSLVGRSTGGAGGAALLAGPALAQVKAGSESGLGLTGAEIPAVLRHTKADPYKAPSAPACLTIPCESKAAT